MRTGCGAERCDENVRTSGRLPPSAGAPGCDSRRRQPPLLAGLSSRITLPDRSLVPKPDLKLLDLAAPAAP